MGPAGSGTATRNAARTGSEERFAQCATNRQPMLCAISTGGAERRAMAASSPRSHSAQTGRSQSRCCTRCQPGCRSSHKVCQWPGPELPMPGTIRATTPSLVVLCLGTPCTLLEPGDRTSTGCAPAGETGREQIPARRRLPIHHFSCAEHSRQRFKHQPLVERLTGHTACRADRLTGFTRTRHRRVVRRYHPRTMWVVMSSARFAWIAHLDAGVERQIDGLCVRQGPPCGDHLRGGRAVGR